MSSSPRSCGNPVIICMPSGGRPASSISSPMRSTVSGHCSGNLTITEAPGGNRARNLVREELGRVVERDDADDNADRLTDRVGHHVLEAGHAVHRQIDPADALGFLGEVHEQPLGGDHLGAALPDRLAVLRREQLDQIVEVAADQVGRLSSGCRTAGAPAAPP